MTEALSIGERLSKARKEKALNLSVIATELNIREQYLSAIEKDDYSKLPGKAYIAGFVKSYAEFLGLDYEEFLKALRATQNLQEDYQNMPQAMADSKKLQKRMFKISVVSVLIVVFAVNYYFDIRHEIDLRKIEEKTDSSETLLNFFYKTKRSDKCYQYLL